jgi:chemotaxis protein histidine kinase CheA
MYFHHYPHEVFSRSRISLGAMEPSGIAAADRLAERVAMVRRRFASTLEARIDGANAALPALCGATAAAAAVAEVYRCVHDIVGIGRTVGFLATGDAAHDVEDVLRPSYRAGRGLNAAEITPLEKSLQKLRESAARELQCYYALSP